MRFLIGLDDTDNADSRGTGFRARHLGELLTQSKLATLEGVTRHQLLVDARIPYTSHNSAACLLIAVEPDQVSSVASFCRDYLTREAAEGADVGFCLAAWEMVTDAVVNFGQRAKIEVLTQAEAQAFANGTGILLEGLTGTHGGVIGALAAIGLRKNGNDGRFLWLKGLRELEGLYSAKDLKTITGIQSIRPAAQTDGRLQTEVPDNDKIDIGEWARPILQDGLSVLLVEEIENHEPGEWRVVAKATIKGLSEYSIPAE